MSVGAGTRQDTLIHISNEHCEPVDVSNFAVAIQFVCRISARYIVSPLN